MNTYDALVIILSITLAVFLILGIIFLSYAIKVVKTVKRLSEKAESVVDNAGNITSNLTKLVTPSLAGKYIFNAVNKAIKHRKKG
jgi:hypothetical protein